MLVIFSNFVALSEYIIDFTNMYLSVSRNKPLHQVPLFYPYKNVEQAKERKANTYHNNDYPGLQDSITGYLMAKCLFSTH